MKNWKKLNFNAIVLALGSAYLQPVFAQPVTIGTVTYAPLSAASVQSVPTLSEWGLISASVLLVALSYRALRSQNRQGLRSWAVGLLAAVAFACVPLGGDVRAASAANVVLDNPAGGTAEVPYSSLLDQAFADYMYEYTVKNSSGKNQKITGISVNAAYRVRSEGDASECKIGNVLAPEATCTVLVAKNVL